MVAKRTKPTEARRKMSPKQRKSPAKAKDSGNKTLMAGAAIGSAAIAAALLWVTRTKKPADTKK